MVFSSFYVFLNSHNQPKDRKEVKLQYLKLPFQDQSL